MLLQMMLLRTKLSVLMYYCVNYSFSYELMKSCWKETPAERPRFKKIVTTLKEIISYDAGSSNENDIVPTPSLESIEETANQTRRHIRPNGPVSYTDLSRNVPASYTSSLRWMTRVPTSSIRWMTRVPTPGRRRMTSVPTLSNHRTVEVPIIS